MTHPLFDLADALDRYRKRRRGQEALNDALADPHRARDVGLPHRPRHLTELRKW